MCLRVPFRIPVTPASVPAGLQAIGRVVWGLHYPNIGMMQAIISEYRNIFFGHENTARECGLISAA